MAGGRLRAFGNRAGIAPLRNRDLRMPGKRVQIDNESWAALDLLAHDRMMTFQELADEAFADLLKKHGRPVDLRAALRRSAGASADVIPLKGGKAKPERRGRGK
ncbi:MAG TPA: hypothetical protein VMF32_05390 [Xanthobacteraceae bacterium]|nr:hypothetical protein [Xanthobacteraceae bacterium]